MIIYTEKGRSLQLAITAAGEALGQDNRDWVCSNESVVQLIIDNHNPVPYEREQAKIRLVEQSQEAFESAISALYPKFEIATFDIQRGEALAYDANRNAPTPNIDRIAARKGTPKSEVVARIIFKAGMYEEVAFNYLAERQRLEDIVDLETDWAVIAGINFIAPVI